MSDGRADDRQLCVVGDETAVTFPDGATRVEDRAAADAVVAIGESAVLELVREECATPILPVDAGVGVRSVHEADLDDALEHVCAGETTTSQLPVLGIEIGDESRGRALFDVMLVTSEAAHISEFDIETPREEIADFRADGVLVATAAGTSGYARRVGAPVFEPEIDAAAVVPVAPFATALDHWVVSSPERGPLLTARVVRAEAGVSLLVDDRSIGPVPPFTDVTVRVVDEVRILRVPESRSCFARPKRSPRTSGNE